MKTQLLEKSRQDLINQSTRADITKRYGTTRYARKNHVSVYNTIQSFNKVDQNSLYKSDVLSFILPINGESDIYEVEILFQGVMDDIRRQVKANNYKLEYKCVYRAIISAINNQDIYVGCSCADYKYRFQYWATKDRYNSMAAQLIPADQTNPRNSQGAGCKHILNVLANLDWALKLASSIYNYMVYMEQNMPEKYQQIMFPVIFGMSYQQALDQGIVGEQEEDEFDDLPLEDEEPIEEPQEEEPVEEPVDEPEEEETEDEQLD